ncbi:unnamed protein product [Pleuronectes platessa]|uniref:Uncharacterized protein n=1 Tax=Pleuronectes platessa TaxID=8262 RepID=A0A9N7YEU6_PLEPL|nr:unnamed protein product [Pleuronectes platessa]
MSTRGWVSEGSASQTEMYQEKERELLDRESSHEPLERLTEREALTERASEGSVKERARSRVWSPPTQPHPLWRRHPIHFPCSFTPTSFCSLSPGGRTPGFRLHMRAEDSGYARRTERKTEREKKEENICFHPQPSRGELGLSKGGHLLGLKLQRFLLTLGLIYVECEDIPRLAALNLLHCPSGAMPQ